jgi:cytochrome c oxidase subunit 7c
MLARATFRAASAPTLVARRGFQSTRAQMASPYHYPEGPRSNLPFDPLKRGFAFKFWGFMGELGHSTTSGYELTPITGTGFALPFLLAGKAAVLICHIREHILTLVASQSGRRRRTSRKRNRSKHWHGYGSLRAYGTCRINGGLRATTLDITTSISLSVVTTLLMDT